MTSIMGHAGLMFNQYSAAAKALFAVMDTQPNGAEKNAIDAAIRALVDAGYWARMDALLVPKKANTQQSATVDWKRLVEATINGSATWVRANGFVGHTDANSYIDTLYTPSTDGNSYTLNSASMGMIVDTVYADATQRSYFGGVGANGNFVNLSTTDTATIISINGLGATTDASQITADLVVVQRTSMVYQDIYIDGVNVDHEISGSGSLPNASVYLMALNNSGTAHDMIPAKGAMWYAGDEFTGGEQDAIIAIFNTYFAAVA